MSEEELQSYEGPLSGIRSIPDPRYTVIVHYPLPEILFLLIAASVSYCNSLTETAAFGEEKLDWLRKYYPYKHGTPSHDTLSRVLGLISSEAFEAWFTNWVSERFEVPVNSLIAIDGKRLRGSANKQTQSRLKSQGGKFNAMVVNLFVTANNLVVGQRNISESMSEVAGAHQLIDSVDFAGCTISGDANFCGRDLLEKIIDGQGDYLMALKGKHPKLFEATKTAFEQNQDAITIHTTKETSRGREEKRVYRALSVVKTLPEELVASYANLSQVVEVERQRRVLRNQAKPSIEKHYYITSLKEDISRVAEKIRSHWAIENNLHHQLDVGFAEDANRARKNNLATNFSLIRKVAINFLIPGSKKQGIKHKRMRAAFSDERRSEYFQI